MKAIHMRSGGRLGALDYCLTAIGSILAVYSAGMSVGSDQIGLFCGSLIVVGTATSYGIRVLVGGSKAVKADGILYTIAAISAFIFSSDLTAMLPDGGFPGQMASAGVLCWMLVFGSFLCWRDGTLLFQAVPGIALFGLVGCFDTYRNVVFAFFGFLICLCTGFARAHGREMLRLAAESRYFDRAGIRFDVNAPEQSIELYEAVKKGPWRWVAGPEWALLSALAIVMLSLLGAPVIQFSVQGVAGFAKIRMPLMRRQLAKTVTQGPDQSTTTSIGQGPLKGMNGQPVFEIQTDQVRYLRMHTYERYTGSGWVANSTGGSLPAIEIQSMSRDQMVEPVRFSVVITVRQPTHSFALPGEVYGDQLKSQGIELAPDGGYFSSSEVEVGKTINVSSDEARDPAIGRNALTPTPTILEPFLVHDAITSPVDQIAREATQGARDDRAKADALLAAITQHAKYNANAGPTPPGADAVEYFLTKSHEGYCDLFASSMVLMARDVGIPARYVTGYLPDSSERVGDVYVATDRDYHAWAELFFANVGWVIFDPTTTAAVVEGGKLPSLKDGWYNQISASSMLDFGIGALVFTAGAMFWIGRRRRAPGVDRARGEFEQAYVDFSRALRRATGRRRLLSETPGEYLKALESSLNGSYETAASLTKRFEQALYSQEPLDAASIPALRSDLREFNRMLRSRKTDPKPDDAVSEAK